MIKKHLQITLLLSCILIFCSNSINDFDDVGIWGIGHTLEENLSEIDNLDIEGTLSKTASLSGLPSLAEQKFYFEKHSLKARLSYGLIRAPPKYII